MPGRLADKVAIVTGGNSGMGAGTVELFVAEGARVVIAARGEELGQAVADRLGDNALFVRADVSVEADVKAMVDATMAKWGRVDVLFNNAGIGQGFVPPEDFALDDFNRVMTTNLGSCFLGLKYVTPIMKEQGGGSIINNGSTAGVTTDGSGPVYSASKAAVIHITKVWPRSWRSSASASIASRPVRSSRRYSGVATRPSRPRRTSAANSGSPSTSQTRYR